MISKMTALTALAVIACTAYYSTANAAVFTDSSISITAINSSNAFLQLSDGNHITTTGQFTDYFDFGVTGPIGSAASSTILATITQNQFFNQKDITGLRLAGVDSVTFTPGGPVYTPIASFSSGTAMANLQAGGEYAVVITGDAIGSRGGQYSGSGSVSAVPLPGALPLFGGIMIGIGAFAARRRAKKLA